MPQSLDHALEYSEQWLHIIEKLSVPEEEGKWIIEESIYNFKEASYESASCGYWGGWGVHRVDC